jgi:hypothetical protein
VRSLSDHSLTHECRVGREWCSLQYDEVGGNKVAKLEAIAYRKDSRLEIILPRGLVKRYERSAYAGQGCRDDQVTCCGGILPLQNF